MAFYNKKYTDDCRAWISKNQNLHENTIDNIKSFLELGGLLHIYGVAVDNMPDKSLFHYDNLHYQRRRKVRRCALQVNLPFHGSDVKSGKLSKE